MRIRTLLFSAFVCLSCLSLSVIGQRDGYYRFTEQWWEHGWPVVWATRWGAQRDENYLVTRTSSLPLGFPEPYDFYSLGLLADLTVVIVFTASATRLLYLPSPQGWKLSLAHLLAACACLGVALHLLQYFYPVLVFGRDYVHIDDKGWVLMAMPGVLSGVYSTTLVMCEITRSATSHGERPRTKHSS